MHSRTFFSIAILSTIGLVANAQVASTTAAHPAPHKKSAKSAAPSVQEQIKQMREELQTQIDELRSKLAARDAQIEALQTSTQAAQERVAATSVQVQTIGNDVHETTTAVSGLQTTVTNLQAQDSTVATGIRQVQQSQEKLQKSLDEPVALRYKGITIVPGGFLAGESVWRQRAMNADLYTNYNSTPYMNTGEAHTSEWVPSARQTRLSSLFSGNVPFGLSMDTSKVISWPQV
jgi:uncharacterized phage infection (PIP) family protein YhgE